MRFLCSPNPERLSLTRWYAEAMNCPRCRPTHSANGRASIIAMATAFLTLAACTATLKDIMVRNGFSYPFHVSRKAADALELRRGGQCEPTAGNRALLSDGRAKVSDVELERIAWTHCPPGAEAAMFHGPFVYLKGGESAFAMTLSCFGTEEPTPRVLCGCREGCRGRPVPRTPSPPRRLGHLPQGRRSLLGSPQRRFVSPERGRIRVPGHARALLAHARARRAAARPR